MPMQYKSGLVAAFLAATGLVSSLKALASSGAGLTSAALRSTITAANPALFPPESVVGYAGLTVTGWEPAAVETAPAYPYNEGESGRFPLVAPLPHGDSAVSTFDMQKHWGNLSPWYSVPSADYGLPDANPLIPPGCDVVQVHLLYRHGARYPTSGSAPATFAQNIANATKTGFSATGDLAFLNDWTYKLGAELLTPFGRSQNFQLGVAYRQLYGELLDSFRAAGTIPVFRTQSQDRMVKAANNFAAGFFGVPEYLSEVNIEIVVETKGVNNSGAPYETCANANKAPGSLGSTAAAAFAQNAFNSTLARLNSQVTGVTFIPADVIAMLQLCSYETNALGYSAFCDVFTAQDFLNYDYYYDLLFYYGNGPGSPVSAALGKGYLQEFLARFIGEYPAPLSSLNATQDDSPTYFPLNQSIYADATHEVVVLNTLVAFNLTALFAGPPLSVAGDQSSNSFKASKLVPFATHFTTQVLECPALAPTKQIRFLVNDAVIPLHESHPGCVFSLDGLCSFDNVVNVLKRRLDEIDYEWACFGSFQARLGLDYNGRAPKPYHPENAAL